MVTTTNPSVTITNPTLPQSNVHLIKTGDKVGASEAVLLQMLNVKPFAYGLVVEKIYDNGAGKSLYII